MLATWNLLSFKVNETECVPPHQFRIQLFIERGVILDERHSLSKPAG